MDEGRRGLDQADLEGIRGSETETHLKEIACAQPC